MSEFFNMDKKVLIITYYWPPSGGSGVQRWLKFVKYLPSFGWKPIVFTPENPSFATKDESLLHDIPPEAEVVRFPIWEPYDIFLKISSAVDKKKHASSTELVSGKSKSMFQKLSTWVRGNLIIPDPRVFWVKPSSRFLHDFIQLNNISTLITTGPPHSVHLIGYKLKRRNPGLKWLADFRDPWSEWGFLDSLMVGSIARKRHRMLESKVLKAADLVITITPFYVRQFEALSKRKVTLLTNGFDENDFVNLAIHRTDNFVIRHVGTVNEKCDPRPFMLALEELSKEREDLQKILHVDFIGNVHPDFRAFVKKSPSLEKVTTFTPPVPHTELISYYGKASLLLLILTGYKDAEGYMPGKLFEYIATGLPILSTGPEDGDASRLLRETDSGIMIEGSRTQKIKDTLLLHFENWLNNKPNNKRTSGAKYSRKAITGRLAELL